jgi:hypothetical protein
MVIPFRCQQVMVSGHFLDLGIESSGTSISAKIIPFKKKSSADFKKAAWAITSLIDFSGKLAIV